LEEFLEAFLDDYKKRPPLFSRTLVYSKRKGKSRQMALLQMRMIGAKAFARLQSHDNGVNRKPTVLWSARWMLQGTRADAESGIEEFILEADVTEILNLHSVPDPSIAKTHLYHSEKAMGRWKAQHQILNCKRTRDPTACRRSRKEGD
jgi:hypothetical protein